MPIYVKIRDATQSFFVVKMSDISKAVQEAKNIGRRVRVGRSLALDQQGWPVAPEDILCALQHSQLMALDIDLDEADGILNHGVQTLEPAVYQPRCRMADKWVARFQRAQPVQLMTRRVVGDAQFSGTDAI